MFLMLFVFVVDVSANTGILTRGKYVSYNGTDIVYSVDKDTTTGYPVFPYKYTESGAYICLTGFDKNAEYGKTCPLSTNPNDIGLAYLVNEYTGVNGGVDSFAEDDYGKYYWLEVAALYYLGVYTPEPTSNFMTNVYSTKLLNNGKTMETTIAEAKNYQAKYSDVKYTKNIDLSLSSTNLEFALAEDGYYYSQKVYITDANQNSDVFNISVDNNKFEKIDQTDINGRYLQLKISKNEVTSNITTVNVIVSGSYEYYKSNFYDCSGAYQDLISAKTNKKTNNKAIKISGEVFTTELVIKKLDDKDNFLPGVVVKVENEDKTYSQTFTTTDKEIVLNDLKYGKYTVTEESAPEGYVILESSKTIILSRESLSQTVTLRNKLNRVEISKISASDNKLLSGAVLQIQDKDGNVIKDSNGNDYEWTSTEKIYVVEGLQTGTYYLVEKSAPEGYALNKEKVEFVVDNKTDVVEVKMKNHLEVIVPDTLSSRSTLLIAISMFDIALGIGIITYVKKNKAKE